MAVTVKRITIWRTERGDRPGLLADVLGPISAAGANLQVAMGYRLPGESGRAAIEVAPISGSRPVAAAKSAGLAASSIPTLLVTGDDRRGQGHRMAKAIADAGINIHFLVALVVGRKHSAIFGFGSEADAKKAASLIKKAATQK